MSEQEFRVAYLFSLLPLTPPPPRPNYEFSLTCDASELCSCRVVHADSEPEAWYELSKAVSNYTPLGTRPVEIVCKKDGQKRTGSQRAKPIWVDLNPHWSDLESEAHKRDDRKQSTSMRSDRAGRPDSAFKSWETHLIGVCGEMANEVLTGHPMDRTEYAKTDGGTDFVAGGKRHDIKSTVHWRDPHLKLTPGKEGRADVHLLYGVDMAKRRAGLFGWATDEQLRAVKTTGKYGHGKRHSLTATDLRAMGQTGLPEWLEKRPKGGA